MANRLKVLSESLTIRLLVPLIGTVAAVLIVNAVINYRSSVDQWTQITTNGAARTSDLIKSATHYGMLLNRKEDVHHTIRRLAASPDVAGIRIYDKRGSIIFSADPKEVGGQVDLKAEQCVTCHVDGLREIEPLESGKHPSRLFRSPSGDTVLGLINPIRNEPECAAAGCHVHPDEQTVLGVLDVQMSMAFMETALAQTRHRTFWATLVMVLVVGGGTIVFIDRMVRRPVRALYLGTRRVARGELDERIEVRTHDELGRLAVAFNSMTDEIHAARDELLSKNEELGHVQRQILHMEKMASLGKLSATVAHELNNPLAGILTYARLVERQLESGELGGDAVREMLRCVSLVRKESTRCGNIVRNMLLFARRSGLDAAAASLNEIVQNSVMLVHHHLEMSDIRLEESYLAGDDEVICDAGQIQQAVLALLMNAIEAMGPRGGGALSVAVRDLGEAAQIEVADTGPGMPPEVMEHVFEPFFSTKDKESGVGLGLSVVYGIVQRHGGVVEVDSVVGEGTVFRMRLSREPGWLKEEVSVV